MGRGLWLRPPLRRLKRLRRLPRLCGRGRGGGGAGRPAVKVPAPSESRALTGGRVTEAVVMAGVVVVTGSATIIITAISIGLLPRRGVDLPPHLLSLRLTSEMWACVRLRAGGVRGLPPTLTEPKG